MALPNDALVSKQWYLKAIGVDRLGYEYAGRGISTGIFDDGIDTGHEDLRANYDASKEFKLGGVAQAPNVGSSFHGTSVAGIIAAAANGIGMVGIAHLTKITGIDIFGNAGGSAFAAAFRTIKDFHSVNHSWGWTDKFADSLSTAFGQAQIASLKLAADTGRGGLGTLVFNSGGNQHGDDGRSVNSSEFSASRYTITVGAIGEGGDVAYYSDRGSAILVSAPSSGGGSGITTTAQTGTGIGGSNYTANFGGTSAASPIATAVGNLMLEASGNLLGWRDAQEILALTADHTTPTGLKAVPFGQMAYGWQINGAGHVDGGGMHYSNDVGYGRIDAFEAVRYAEVWRHFGPAKTSANEAVASATATLSKAILDKGLTSFTIAMTQTIEIEHVDLTLHLDHQNIHQLKVELVSAEGTTSVLLSPSSGPAYAAAGFTWSLGSEALRGELSAGIWTVKVTDTVSGLTGTINSAKLDIYGEAVTVDDVYHYTNEFETKMLALSSSRATLTDSNGGTDWINLAGQTKDVVADLAVSGGSIAFAGVKKVAIVGTIEHAVAGDGNDTLLGNDGANKLLGMRGNDTIEGKGGADTIDGGAGVDTASYASSNLGVTVDLKAATQIGGHAQGDVLVSIENLTGSAFADTLKGDGRDNVLKGGGGNDLLFGDDGADTAVFSGRASDYLITKGTDAAGAYLQLAAKAGIPDGTDKVYGTEIFVFADQTLGADKLPVQTTTATPTQPPTVAGSTFLTTARADVFAGTAGNDTIRFAEIGGSDRFDGGAGIDTLDLSGLAANTRVWVQLNSGDSWSIGAAYGTARNVENIVGSAGNDTLYGNALDNRIEGGAGDDALRGYAGRDVFVFGKTSGRDTIYDFRQGEDRLDFGTGLAQLTLKISGADLLVSDADSFVTLANGANLHLTASDFLV